MPTRKCLNPGGDRENVSNCFLCLSRLSTLPPEFPPKPKPRSRKKIKESTGHSSPILRYISRYFDMDIHHGNHNLDKFSEKVSSCDQCHFVVEEFIKLFDILEVTEIKMTDCIRKMHGIMSKAGKGSPKGLSTSSSWVESRKETMNQCAQKLNSVLPQIKLHRTMPIKSEVMEESYLSDFEGDNDDAMYNLSESNPSSPVPMDEDSIDSTPDLNDVEVDITAFGNDPNWVEEDEEVSGNEEKNEVQLRTKSATRRAKSDKVGPKSATRRAKSHKVGPKSATRRAKSDKVGPKSATRRAKSDKVQPETVPEEPVDISYIEVLDPKKWYVFNKPPQPSQSTTTERSRGTWTKSRQHKNIKCDYCEAIFCAKDSVPRLEAHFLKFHPEHYFPSLKSDNLSDNDFRKLLMHLLFKEENEEELEEGGNKEVRKCPVCPKEYPMSKKVNFKMHMIHRHHDALLEKINRIQSDPDLEERLAKYSSIGGTCFHCGIYLKTSDACDLHENSQCPHNPLRGHEQADYLVDSVVSVKGEGNGLERKRPKKDSVGKLNVTNVIEEGNGHSRCFYCNCIFLKRNGYKNSFESSIHRHLMRFHPEHYFAGAKEDSLSEQEFQVLVRKLLFQEFLEEDESEGTISCMVCAKAYYAGIGRNSKAANVNESLIKMHLIKEHFETCNSKLASFQQDPEVLQEVRNELLESRNLCRYCGSYFSYIRTVNYHEFNYCLENPSSVDESRKKIDSQNQKRSISDNEDEDEDSMESDEHNQEKKVEEKKKRKRYVPRPSKDKEGHTRCFYCNCVFLKTSSNSFERSIHRHLIRFHPEHYFPSAKKSSLSDNEFQVIVRDLLFPEFQANSDDKISCTLCPKDYLTVGNSKPAKSKSANSNCSLLKMHLVNHHLETLTDKLIKLQEDTEVLQEVQIELGEDKNRTCSKKCKFCETYFPKFGAASYHQKMYCLKNPASTKKTRNKADSQLEKDVVKQFICEDCGIGVSTSKALAVHRKNTCKVIRKQSGSPSQPRRRRRQTKT